MGGDSASTLAALYERKHRIDDVERRADDAAENVDRAIAALEACAAGDLGTDAAAVRRGLADAARSLEEVLSATRSHAAGVERAIGAAWNADRSGAAGRPPAGPTPAGLPPGMQDPEMGS